MSPERQVHVDFCWNIYHKFFHFSISICSVFKHFPWFIWTLLSPASKKKILLIIFFLRWHHQPSSIDRVMCLAIHCQSLQALAYNCITGFHTIPSHPSLLEHFWYSNDLAFERLWGKNNLYRNAMLFWESACSNWQWIVRHRTLSIGIGWWCYLMI